MKVLVISPLYPSKTSVASGIFVHKQVQKLREKGCEVKVICPVPYVPYFLRHSKLKKYIDIPRKDFIDGVEVIYPRYLELPRGFLLEYLGYSMYIAMRSLIKKLYSEFKFDVIHAHTALPVGFTAMLLKRHYKIPVVVTVHGQDLQFTIRKNLKCRKNLFKVFEQVDKIVTVSGKLKNILSEQTFADKVIIINNGINPDECLCTNDDEPVINNSIVSVSWGLIKTKGIDLNIRAVAKLVKKYPDLKYFIVGSGGEENSLKALTEELKITDNVVFVGKLPHNKAIEYISRTNIMSLPSWQEGFGIVYIEAMAQGKPVIAVKGEGIEDIIVDGENGFLVRPQNVDDIAEKLDFLLSNPKVAQEMGERAKESVLSNYTWSRNAEKNIDIYKEIIKNNGVS